MAGLHSVRALFSASVEIPAAALERHSPFSPQSLGEQLARQIDTSVREQALGYYPALDYFRDRGVLDAATLEVLEQLVWLGTSLVREEVSQRLRPWFAGVQVQSMQSLVYSLPSVRPGRADSVKELARHLTPNRAKFDLLLTLIRKDAASEQLERYIERVACRHLSDSFATVRVGGIKLLEQDG